jgi:hypothetical protein
MRIRDLKVIRVDIVYFHQLLYIKQICSYFLHIRMYIDNTKNFTFKL